MTHKLILTGVFWILALVCSAQSFLNWQLRDRYFSIYAGTGWSGYFGELTNGNPMSNGFSNYNFGIEASLYSKIATRVQGTYYRIEGSDTNAPDSSANRQRNLSFQSKNWEWNFQAMYYFLKYQGKYHKRRTYEPYFAIGIGQTFYNPKGQYNGVDYALRELGTENQSYGKSAWVIPVGLGMKAAFNEFLNVTLDVGYRYSFSSHLDDVSGSYAGPFDLGTIEGFLSNRSDQIPTINQEAFDSISPGASRGTGKNDSYLLISVSIELYIPGDIFKSKQGDVPKEKWMSKPSAYD